jgi:hypothetical protein
VQIPGDSFGWKVLVVSEQVWSLTMHAEGLVVSVFGVAGMPARLV